ncbi:hypothetical protein JJC00_35800 [Bradyrhizobium diazoefficiens]|uniref:hypothetical protein n=1 Tax=Bradyrhizobium diazoefficiens TaxID=1355477 RepID=UPI00190E3FB2|nr:hypothetical protein [Bradyrhizobium diazoefficiens]QQO33796.1 hypothetical protein JJC00_35800 [Bradyrhizobium diazoefficiens]
MSRLSRHTIPTVALTLISFGAFTQQALAEPENCSARFNHCIRDGEKLGSFNACNRAEKACQGRNRDRGYKGNEVQGRGTEGKEKNTGGKGGGKTASDGATWNGEYTTVVVTDNAGTSTYTVKQGVPIENGQMILAPNGASYHVWDPELARQLKAAGVNAAYANPAAAKNEYALSRDKVVRDRAIAAGQPVPPPTGHRNDDALGNRAPVVNDHRNGGSPKPDSPPPAAAPGTVSSTPVSNPDAVSRVSDHRHPAGAASGHEGGVTVTQTTRTAGSGSASGDGNRRQK